MPGPGRTRKLVPPLRAAGDRDHPSWPGHMGLDIVEFTESGNSRSGEL